MATTEKVSRYNVIEDFSLGLEATPSIQHKGDQVDLTDEQAKEFAKYIEPLEEYGDRTHIVVKRGAEVDGESYDVGDMVVLSPGEWTLLGDKVVDVEDELDDKEKVKRPAKK